MWVHGGGTGAAAATVTVALRGLVAALLLVGCAEVDTRGGDAPGEPSSVAELTVEDRPQGVPADAQPASLDRVVDGDTIRVVAVQGGVIEERTSVRVRLLNIDAPELARDGEPAECLAEEATARVGELLADSEVVWLAADDVDRDRFDRPLRGVWNAEGVFLNEVLAAEGLATSVLFNDNDRFLPQVEAAEARAERSGRGLHGDACR